MSGCFCLFLDGETSPESIACRKAAGRLSVFGTGWFLSILLSVSLGQSACAETLNWTGAGGGSWSASTNWAPSAHVPDAGDDVLINSDGPVVVTSTSATANSVTVGQVSSGTLVINGSLLSNSLSLGVAAGIGGTVTFSGATLQNQGLLSVGGNGIGTLSLLYGSAVSTGTVYIGEGATGNGFLTLDNSSSLVTAGTIFVGYGGGSAPSGGGNGELKILAGSTVDSQRAILGEGAGTEGATLISGAGSRWTVAADTVIGNAGVSTLTVTGGGKLLSGTTTVIANLYSASGSEVTLTRLGSSLETGQLIVGNGGSARLTVEAAASATSDSAIIGRHSTSVATVTGDGSTWVAGDLQIGGDVADPGGASGNGTLNVTAGGKVNSTAARLGTVAGATGAAIIDGEGSAWTVGSGGLAIGDAGTGSLAVTGGGIVGSQAVVLGNSAASTGSARISGVGSTLRSEGDIIVGRGGNAMMSVEAGGAVESRNGVVAALGGSSSSVTVTGGGSSWTMTGTLIAGYQDTASAEVTASAGGNIRAGEVVLGDLSRSSGTMTITGASSNVTAYVDSGLGASGRMTVGQSGSGGLTVTNGASLNAYLFSVGSSAGSDGAVLVNGIGSRVSVGDTLVIGAAGNGSVEVTGGAALAAPTILIASSAGSAGVLNVGAASGQTARSAGTIDAQAISFGAGAGRIVFNHSQTAYLVKADISGAGSVVAENGVTTLAGNNSYSGGTTISGGTLKGIAGSFGSGEIANDAALVVDGAGRLSNAIHGRGSFEKTGAGNLELSAVSTYLGPTTVSGGKLSVNGSLASAVSVVDGAALGGTGTVAGLSIGPGGTLAPGNPLGTLTSTGDATFAAGGRYAVDIDTAGNSDRLAVNGTVTIANDVTLVVTPLTNRSAFSLNTRYQILTATGGITGAFSRIDESFAYLTATIAKSDDTGTAYLSFSPASSAPGFLAAQATTANARAAANAVEALGENAALYQSAIFLQGGETQLAFSQLSGEIHPSVAMTLINRSSQTRDVILERLRRAFDSIDARPIMPVAFVKDDGGLLFEEEGSPSFWTSGLGSRGRVDGDGNGSSVDSKGGGILFGLDGELGKSWRAGVAGGYSHERIEQKTFAASAEVDSYFVAAYAGTMIGPASLRFGAIHAFQDMDTRRSVSFSTLSENLSASYGGSTSQVFAEAAWRFDFDLTHVEPYANIAYVNSRTGDFGEKGGIAAVSSASARYDQLYTTLGARITRDVALEGMLGRAMFDLAWRHNYGDTEMNSSLFYEGGEAFSVVSTRGSRDAATLNLGLSYDLTPSATLTFRYGAVFGAGLLDQSAAAELGVRF